MGPFGWREKERTGSWSMVDGGLELGSLQAHLNTLCGGWERNETMTFLNPKVKSPSNPTFDVPCLYPPLVAWSEDMCISLTICRTSEETICMQHIAVANAHTMVEMILRAQTLNSRSCAQREREGR